MTFGRQFAVLVVALGLLLSIGCQKKKQQLTLNKQAPTLAVPVPEQIPEETLPSTPPPANEEATVEEPPPKKPPQKHRSAKKPATAPPATQPAAVGQGNTTVAVNRPPVNPALEAPTDMAIAADVSSEKLLQQKQTTADLLESTEKDLKSLNRTLNHDEETMLTQIKSYIAQSHKATSDGDFERAFNLAKKAQLLADALVKK